MLRLRLTKCICGPVDPCIARLGSGASLHRAARRSSSATVCSKSSIPIDIVVQMLQTDMHQSPERLTRRSALGQLFGAAAGLVLVGCGDVGESEPAASVSSGVPSSRGDLGLSGHVVEVWRDPG